MMATQNACFRKAAGPRLRCFLERALWLSILFLAACRLAHAQLEIPGPIHLTHVDGYVTDTSGKPVVDLEVTLSRDETVAFRTRTDRVGAFQFDRISGRFLLRVARSRFAPAAREVTVGDEIVTRVERKRLYIVVGPGACADECSSVFTSKRDFERAIRKNTGHE